MLDGGVLAYCILYIVTKFIKVTMQPITCLKYLITITQNNKEYQARTYINSTIKAKNICITFLMKSKLNKVKILEQKLFKVKGQFRIQLQLIRYDGCYKESIKT